MKLIEDATIVSKDGNYRKLIQETVDYHRVETSILDYRENPDLDNDKHLIVCFSTQIGCAQKCPFCASGAIEEIAIKEHSVYRTRLIRNLTDNEITLQIKNAIDNIGAMNKKDALLLSAMGMGEPFDNFDALLSALNNLPGTVKNRARVTLSTIGRETDRKKIDRFAKIIKLEELGMPSKLHFSLHGSNDLIRHKLVPNGMPIKDLFDTIYTFVQVSNTRPKLNYVLLNEINDSIDCAKELAKVLIQHPVGQYVTMKISEANTWKDFRASNKEKTFSFIQALDQEGISTVEFSSVHDGGLVNAGCGQLRKSY